MEWQKKKPREQQKKKFLKKINTLDQPPKVRRLIECVNIKIINMKIIHKKDAVHADKPEGTSVDYYLRDEYELHCNEQAPNTTQTWHHHKAILEALFIIEGELTAEWKENGENKKQPVKSGDLIETENTPHTFSNHTDKAVRFIVIKLVPIGKNKKEILKNDKIIDE
jgi:mannose-6-phosphate isomerase-like protein (cupin superfamily)